MFAKWGEFVGSSIFQVMPNLRQQSDTAKGVGLEHKTKAGGLSHIEPYEIWQHAIYFHLGGFLESDTCLTAARNTLPADGLYFAFVLNK